MGNCAGVLYCFNNNVQEPKVSGKEIENVLKELNDLMNEADQLQGGDGDLRKLQFKGGEQAGQRCKQGPVSLNTGAIFTGEWISEQKDGVGI